MRDLWIKHTHFFDNKKFIDVHVQREDPSVCTPVIIQKMQKVLLILRSFCVCFLKLLFSSEPFEVSKTHTKGF